MKKLITILGITAMTGAFVLGASVKNSIKEARATTGTNYYMPFNETNFTRDGEHGYARLGHIRTQNETTWNGRFNALDSFFTGEGSGVGEDVTGYFDSVPWQQKKDYPYVYFTLAGNASNEIEVRKNDTDKTLVTKINNDQFNGNPMVLNYIAIDTSGLTEGEELFLRINDNSTSSYGFVTFGYLHVNASATDVSDAIWLHINSLSIRYENYPNENDFREANYRIRETMNFYLNGKASTNNILTLSSNKNLSADEDFESNNDFLDGWYRDAGHDANTGYEDGFADKTKNWGTIISTANHHFNNHELPFNKTGNGFFKGYLEDNTGFLASDNARYRFVSKPFVLSGDGIISIKMAGRPASVHVVRGNVNLAYIDNKTYGTEEENITNGNTGCTMVRHVINLNAFKDQVIQIAIADVDTGGTWGAVNFDDLVTKYDSTNPFSFKVDKAQQYSVYNHYLDHYVSSSNADIIYVDETTRNNNASDTSDFKKAADFLSTYYSTVRAKSNGCTYCGKDVDTSGLLYNSLTPTAKDIVARSDDFDHTKTATKDTWSSIETVIRNGGVGDTLVELGIIPAPSSTNLLKATSNNDAVVMIVVITSVATLLAIAFFAFKKKKQER